MTFILKYTPKQVKHNHTFKLVTKKVLVHKDKSIPTAIDILKQRVCNCGKTETYDLERTVL